MHVSKPTLHLMARDAIAEIEATGVTVLPEEVLWLHELAQRESQNSDLTELSYWLDMPRRCGPLTFYPLCITAENWVQDYATLWFDGDKRMEVLALAYVLCHGRDPKAYESIVTEKAARSAIRNWAWSLPLTYLQIATAVNEFFSKDEQVEVTKETESERLDIRRHWGWVIPYLMRYYGGSREDWVYRKSAREFREMVNKLPEVMGNDAKDGKFDRHIQFRAVVEWIIGGRKQDDTCPTCGRVAA